MSEVRFYFDYISPYAYLASARLPEIAERTGVTVEPVPILFAGLLHAHGQRGPAEIPAKARWLVGNVLRLAARHGVALEPPAHHPFNPLLALRVTAALPAADRWPLVAALFRAVWVEARHVSERDVVESVVDGLGLRGAELVATAETPEVKRRLRESTEEAIERGVFGVPTFELLGGDLEDDAVPGPGLLFWGCDDLPHLELALEGADPLDRERAERWRRVRPSAVRDSG